MFAILCWQLFTRETPFNGETIETVIQQVVLEQARPHSIAEYQCPPPIFQLIQQCWNANPEQRPSFNKIIQDLRDILFLRKSKAVYAKISSASPSEIKQTMTSPASAEIASKLLISPRSFDPTLSGVIVLLFFFSQI